MSDAVKRYLISNGLAIVVEEDAAPDDPFTLTNVDVVLDTAYDQLSAQHAQVLARVARLEEALREYQTISIDDDDLVHDALWDEVDILLNGPQGAALAKDEA